jgi:hypothetical protein
MVRLALNSVRLRAFTPHFCWPILGVLGFLACPQFEAVLDREVGMARQFLGVTPRRWMEYLVAILLGNAIYYFSLVPHLPEILRHQGFQVDLGMFLDFLVCAAVYGLIRLAAHL